MLLLVMFCSMQSICLLKRIGCRGVIFSTGSAQHKRKICRDSTPTHCYNLCDMNWHEEYSSLRRRQDLDDPSHTKCRYHFILTLSPDFARLAQLQSI